MSLRKGTCNGIALWVDWILDADEKYVVSTGPSAPIRVDHQVSWDMHSRQGVYLFVDTVSQVTCLSFTTCFNPKSGNISFDFEPEKLKVVQPA